MQSDDENGDIDVTSDEDGSLEYRNGVDVGDNQFEDEDDAFLNMEGGPDEEVDKRAHHNALERKRRDHIKESFSSLRDSLPNIQGEKSSRAQILKQATDYIENANGRNKKRCLDINDLKEENRRLLFEVAALEKAAGLQGFPVKHGKEDRPSSSESDAETGHRSSHHVSKPRRKKVKS